MNASASTTESQPERVALVTGASRGLGAAMAEALGARGWQIVALARTTGALEELDDRIRSVGGPPATLVPLDITHDDAMRHLCASLHQRWGGIDLWVHAAIHAPPLSPAGHVAMKDFDRALAVTLRATGALIPMVEPLLRARQGAALFFDDPLWHDDTGAARKFFAAHGAAKAGQMALARAWVTECAALGPERAPRVFIETPAPMPTASRARFFPGEDRAALSKPKAEAARLIERLKDTGLHL
ncbi:MAG: SDR family oxidoreductase [Pararhodobacter sp.]|nr:SDR family oxidoreductase [Pararhodobacter sp.]